MARRAAANVVSGSLSSSSADVFKGPVSSGPAGGLGITLTVDYSGWGIPALVERAQHMAPFWRHVLAELKTRADIYLRPDRFLGLPAVERGGYRINWAPGYPGYAGYTVEEAGDDGVLLESRRPYHPEPTEGTIARWVQEGARFILSGSVPS